MQSGFVEKSPATYLWTTREILPLVEIISCFDFFLDIYFAMYLDIICV